MGFLRKDKKNHHAIAGVYWQEWRDNSWIRTRASIWMEWPINLKKCDNESYSRKLCHKHITCPIRCLGQHFYQHSKSAAVTPQESWRGGGGGWAVFVATNFFNFTVNFLGNYWCFWWTFNDTRFPPVRRCTCKLREDGAELLTPIPTSYKWTLSSLVTPVAFSQHDESGQWGQLYFICTTRLRMGRLDHDLFVWVCVSVFGCEGKVWEKCSRRGLCVLNIKASWTVGLVSENVHWWYLWCINNK